MGRQHSLFDLIDGIVTIAPQVLEIKAFKRLWDRDKSRHKKIATEELSFVFYFSDIRSMYQSANDQEKTNLIKKDVITATKWKPDKAVWEACTKYRELFTSPSIRFLEKARIALNALGDYFEHVDFSVVNNRGDPVYKVREIAQSLKDSEGILTSLKRLEERVMQEQEDFTIRGGGQKGLMEDPDSA